MCVGTRSAPFGVLISLKRRGRLARLKFTSFYIYTFLLVLQDVAGAGSLRAAPNGCRSLKLCLGATLAKKIRPVELSTNSHKNKPT